MKKALLSGVALVALACGSAAAADLPSRRAMPVKAPEAVAVTYNWSGIYVGGHLGGAWGEKCFTFTGVNEGCHDVSGWLGGGQIGFNWQTGNFVIGAEFSGSWSDLDGSHVLPGTTADTYDTRVDSIFLLTARAGLTFDRVLAYVTGGGAWVRDRYSFFDSPAGTTASARETRWGWTVGAGLEFALTSNWSIAGQYNYIDLGDRNVSFSGSFGSFTENIDQHLHVATVRLNYRFGGPVVARY